MSERTKYSHGCFCWVDLSAQDVDLAKRFYTGLFGWEAEDKDAGPGGVYTVYKKEGRAVASQYALDPHAAAQGVPSRWQTYISVDNVDKALERTAAKGGHVIAGPFDVADAGRTATIQDPSGAQIALWQPGEFAGAEVVNETHAWCWSELQTRDTSSALRFYTGLFGWGAKISEGSGGAYTSFLLNNREIGGMIEIQPDWGDHVPAAWNVYFTVDDLAASKARAQELSGRAMTPPLEAADVGVFQLFRDSQGAHFCLIEMNQDVTPE